MSDIKFACPHCRQHVQCDESHSGRKVACPNCKASLRIPRRGTAGQELPQAELLSAPPGKTQPISPPSDSTKAGAAAPSNLKGTQPVRGLEKPGKPAPKPPASGKVVPGALPKMTAVPAATGPKPVAVVTHAAKEIRRSKVPEPAAKPGLRIAQPDESGTAAPAVPPTEPPVPVTADKIGPAIADKSKAVPSAVEPAARPKPVMPSPTASVARATVKKARLQSGKPAAVPTGAGVSAPVPMAIHCLCPVCQSELRLPAEQPRTAADATPRTAELVRRGAAASGISPEVPATPSPATSGLSPQPPATTDRAQLARPGGGAKPRLAYILGKEAPPSTAYPMPLSGAPLPGSSGKKPRPTPAPAEPSAPEAAPDVPPDPPSAEEPSNSNDDKPTAGS